MITKIDGNDEAFQKLYAVLVEGALEGDLDEIEEAGGLLEWGMKRSGVEVAPHIVTLLREEFGY